MIEIKIRFDETNGSLTVDGPGSLVHLFGLLELAKVNLTLKQLQAQRVSSPTPMDLALLGKRS